MNANPELTNMPGIPHDDDGPVFAEPWQAHAFAMAVSLNEQGLFDWKEWAQVISTQIAKDGDPDAYYHHWLNALEIILERNKTISNAERQACMDQWDQAAKTTPHGQPIMIDRPSAK